jgi:hypothetical protein
LDDVASYHRWHLCLNNARHHKGFFSKCFPNDVTNILFLKKFSFSFLYLPLQSKIVLSISFEKDFGKKFGTPSSPPYVFGATYATKNNKIMVTKINCFFLKNKNKNKKTQTKKVKH